MAKQLPARSTTDCQYSLHPLRSQQTYDERRSSLLRARPVTPTSATHVRNIQLRDDRLGNLGTERRRVERSAVNDQSKWPTLTVGSYDLERSEKLRLSRRTEAQTIAICNDYGGDLCGNHPESRSGIHQALDHSAMASCSLPNKL